MGNIIRKQKRRAAKKAYEKFKKNYSNARRKQLSMSVFERERELERGHIMLGPVPTFNQWWDSINRINRTKDTIIIDDPKEIKEFIEESLSWDDE